MTTTANSKFGNYALAAPTDASQYIEYDNGSIITGTVADEFMMEMWINPISYVTYGTFVEMYYSGMGQRLWLGHQATNNNTLLFYLNGANVLTTSPIANLYDGNYKSISIYKPYNSSEYTIYVNAVAVGTTAATNDIPIYQNIRIGSFSGGGYPGNALIDEFRLTIGGSRGAPTTLQTEQFLRG